MFNNEQDPQEAALEEEEVLLVAMALMVRGRRQRRRRRVRNRKRFWVRPGLLRRPLYGQYEHLMQELYREDVNTFTNFLRVTPEMFMELVERVGPRIEKRGHLLEKSPRAWASPSYNTALYGHWRLIPITSIWF